MTRTYLPWALLLAAPIAATLAIAVPEASAQPRASAAPATSAAASAKAKDGGDSPPAPAASEKKEETAAEKQLKEQDRSARRALMRGALKAKLAPLLKGPMDDAFRAELKRNAETSARLLRVRELAYAAKDTDTINKATALIEKEKARHEKWLTDNAGKGSK